MAHWRRWWLTSGRFENRPIITARTVKQPKKSANLAEFIGIMMGDGSLSKYQAVITLHHKDDFEYSQYIVKLIKKLFRITPKIYHSEKYSVNDICVSRVELVRFLHSLGLPIGNKVAQQFDIPDWIRKSKRYSRACVRGLIDTDGSVVVHRYRVKGKVYSYGKISFTSRSTPLLTSVRRILSEHDMHPTLNGFNVRLESQKDVEKYFRYFESCNPKHLKRYRDSRTMRP